MFLYTYLLFFLLALCLIIALTCFVERLMRLHHIQKQGFKLALNLKPLLEKKHWQQAARLCQQEGGTFGEIMQAGLLQRAHTQANLRMHVQEVLEEEAAREMSAVERPIYLLCIIAQIAPLIGLLATLLMTSELFTHARSFQEIEEWMQRGILAIAYGLVIAIPSLIGYHVLMLRAERCALAIDQMAGDLLDQMACEE